MLGFKKMNWKLVIGTVLISLFLRFSISCIHIVSFCKRDLYSVRSHGIFKISTLKRCFESYLFEHKNTFRLIYRIVAKRIFFKLMQTVLRLELDLYVNKEIILGTHISIFYH